MVVIRLVGWEIEEAATWLEIGQVYRSGSRTLVVIVL